jgi:phosphoserine aminotransferase
MITTTKPTTSAATARVHNFGAGPAALPLPVLERVQAELLDYAGTGMSVMELSHRSAAFEAIAQKAEADLRALTGFGAEHAVLFLQGGASLQFAMLPANLRGDSASADYLVTGHWSKAALAEARKQGQARAAASSEATGFDRLPERASFDLDPRAAYLHYTSNNTIFGTAWREAPEPPGGVPLACDASSDALSGPFDAARHAVYYAGAQKNLGPAGVTIVVIRRDLLERVPAGLPAMLDYKLLSEHKSLYNTPPTFAIYVTGLVLEWLRALGGLAAIGARNASKAARLYAAIDRSAGFYRGHAQPDSRSRMNVTFRLADAALEKAFLAQAEAEGFSGLKGHRSVGGVRASIYNACSEESADALAGFMDEFRRTRG